MIRRAGLIPYYILGRFVSARYFLNNKCNAMICIGWEVSTETPGGGEDTDPINFTILAVGIINNTELSFYFN